LTNGAEVYPHRHDLAEVPRWICDICKNHVGTHYKRKSNVTEPLGNIPNKKIKMARMDIHKLIDPLWQAGKMTRGALYAELSEKLGYAYHTGEIKTIEEARKVYKAALEICHA